MAPHASGSLLSRMQSCPPSETLKRIAALRDDDSFVSRLDRISVLGIGDDDESAPSNQAHYGHTGCVNALSWNEDGSLLVSGSDDFRLCIWRVGHADGSEPPWTATGIRRQQPHLSMGLSTVIHTGHRRNIFSAKFAPHTNSKRLLSCAGDSQVRVFETERAASSTYIKGSKGRNWHEYNASEGCVRVFRCHTDRAKRIALEGSPDVFLTCAEDGTVRQHDLRQAHSCTPAHAGEHCPRPLANYRGYNMGLYTLSVSLARPDVFVVAGTSPYAFLHDRRMTRRSMLEQWGQILKTDLPTQCVRRFGLPSTAAQQNGTTRRNPYHDHHVTATKLSNANGRDLLVSYSGDAIYRYDILADPTADNVVPPVIQETNRTKRKRSAETSSSEQLSKRLSPERPSVNSAPDVDISSAERPASRADQRRRQLVVEYLGLAPNSASDDLKPRAVEEQLDGMEMGEDDEAMIACRRYARALLLSDPPIDLDSIRTAAQEAVEAAHWSTPLSRINYEVSIGENGELRVGFDEALAALQEELDEDYEEPSEEESSSEEDMMQSDVEPDGEEQAEESDRSDEHAFLQSMRQAREKEAGVQSEVPIVLPLAKYEGHRNVDTVKDVNFGGLKDQHIVSGSDDGRMFIWNKATTELEGIWEGDGSVVNVIKFHPLLPVCAVSGIDDTIKLFAPTSSAKKRFACLEEVETIMQRNRDGRNRGRGLMAPSTHALMELLSQRMQNGEIEMDENGNPTRVVRIDRDAECIIS